MDEKSTRTCCVRLDGSPGATKAMMETLILHRQAFNLCSRLIFESKDPNRLRMSVSHKLTYRACMSIPGIKSQFAVKARMAAVAAHKAIRSNKKIPREPVEAKRLAMRLDCRLFRWLPEDGLAISVAGGRMERFSIRPYPRMREMMSSSRMLDPQVFERDGGLWLAVPFETFDPMHVPSRCLGVDLGLRRLATTSVGVVFADKAWLKARRKTRMQKRRLQAKGTRSARRRLRALRRREANQSRDAVGRLSKVILDHARSVGANVVVMEDLEGIKSKDRGRKFNNRLSQAPFRRLRSEVERKARARGMRAETVDPRNTSKEDSRGLPMGVRRGCAYHAADGRVLDADHNAAVNIAMRWARPRKLPVASTLPLRGRQTPWAGSRQPADRARPLAQARGLFCG